MHVICFPIFEARICGFPEVVKLTNAEHKAMARIHLGGIEALRTKSYSCACRTVDSLVRKGLLETVEQCTANGVVRRGGLTALGKRVAASAADAEHESATR